MAVLGTMWSWAISEPEILTRGLFSHMRGKYLKYYTISPTPEIELFKQIKNDHYVQTLNKTILYSNVVLYPFSRESELSKIKHLPEVMEVGFVLRSDSRTSWSFYCSLMVPSCLLLPSPSMAEFWMVHSGGRLRILREKQKGLEKAEGYKDHWDANNPIN